MDKGDLMHLERRKYIAGAISGDRDWATQNDPQEVLHKIGMAVWRYKWDEAREMLTKAIVAAADSHVQQMDNLGRFDDVDIIAELRGMREEMIDLHDSIRGCK